MGTPLEKLHRYKHPKPDPEPSGYVMEGGQEAWDRVTVTVTERRGRGRPSLKPARHEAKGQQQLRELAAPVTIRAHGLAGIRAEMLDEGRGTMAPPSGFYGLGASTPAQQRRYAKRRPRT
jgi:hypothetical protein